MTSDSDLVFLELELELAKTLEEYRKQVWHECQIATLESFAVSLRQIADKNEAAGTSIVAVHTIRNLAENVETVVIAKKGAKS